MVKRTERGVMTGLPRLVTDANDLHSGWDEDCIPYGGDLKTIIKDVLKTNSTTDKG